MRILPSHLSRFTVPKLSEKLHFSRKPTKNSNYLQKKTIWKKFLTLRLWNHKNILLFFAHFNFYFQDSQSRKGYSFPDCFIEVLKNIKIEHYYTHFCAPHLNLQTATFILPFRTDFYFFDEVSRCRELRKWYAQTDK